MTRSSKILAAVVLFSILTTRVSFADNSPQDNTGAHADGRFQEMFSQLGLTDDQKKQLDANKQEHRARMQSARQEIKTCRDELKAQIMKPRLDMARIHQLHNRVKALMSQMEDDKLNSILAVRTILTPDQFTKFVTMMHKHKPDHD